MIKIAICDDEETSLQINKALTEQILDDEGITYEIDCFSDMFSMIEALSGNEVKYQVLLSDILAVGMNGIEAAKKLRELGDKIPIIFISSTAEYALEGYQVNALRYIQKPVMIDKLREALNEACAIANNRQDCLVFQVSDKVYRIPYDKIQYLESQGRETEVVTVDGVISVHMKFSDMEMMLPPARFVRCHRSYIVNLSEVSDLARYRFLTKRGVEIPVSQLQYSEVKMIFKNYTP